MRARPRYAICLNRGSILLEFSSLKICELIKEFSLELVSKELNHLAAILHAYAGVLIL